MRVKDQSGSIDVLLLPLMISVVLVIGLAVFGVWAYSNYSSERDNVEQTVASAVAEAEIAKTTELEAKFAEDSKDPNANFVSSNSIGSVSITYPKTWSAYIEESESGATPLDAYFHPKYVPADDTAYALRASVIEKDYDAQIKTFQRKIDNGDAKAKPIKIEGVVGTRIDGLIDKDINGAIVIIKVRDKTLQVWTEAEKYISDFNKVIENLTFEP